MMIFGSNPGTIAVEGTTRALMYYQAGLGELRGFSDLRLPDPTLARLLDCLPVHSTLATQVIYYLDSDKGKKMKNARFLINGCAVDISTGQRWAKGSNVIHHPIYWDVPQEWIDLMLGKLRKQNPSASVRVSYH